MSSSVASMTSKPIYYHREYKNDIPNVKSEESPESSWADECKRVALVALPFFSLYKPMSFPLSLAMGGLRTFTCVNQLLTSIKSGNSEEIPYAMLQTSIAVIALAGTIFAHPLGMLISTGHDLIIEMVHLIDNLRKGEYQKAMENCFAIINNALYLALFLRGGLELAIASLAVQILIGLYNSQGEFRKGHCIEGVGHLLMSMVRGNQLTGQVKLLQMQSAIQALARAGNVKSYTQPLMGVRAVDAPCGDNTVNEAGIYHSDTSGKLKEEYIKSISEAKSSIVIMTFTFSDPEIINLLIKKADEGLKITIVIDKDHMGSLLPHADKFSLLTRRTGEGRLHHKITVIDQETTWIGSANLSPDSFTKQNNTMIRLKNREMATALYEEMEVFLGIRQRSSRPLPPIIINGQKIELLLFPNVPFGVANSPEQALNEYGKMRILQMINDARTSLRFAVCVWTDPELMQAVIAAKHRGVDIEVIVWKEEESTLQALKLAGIKVTQKPHLQLMHNKWMLVDNENFLNCSANWSRSWFSRNDESSIIINNLTHKQRQNLIDYWKGLLLS